MPGMRETALTRHEGGAHRECGAISTRLSDASLSPPWTYYR